MVNEDAFLKQFSVLPNETCKNSWSILRDRWTAGFDKYDEVLSMQFGDYRHCSQLCAERPDCNSFYYRKEAGDEHFAQRCYVGSPNRWLHNTYHLIEAIWLF